MRRHHGVWVSIRILCVCALAAGCFGSDSVPARCHPAKRSTQSGNEEKRHLPMDNI